MADVSSLTGTEVLLAVQFETVTASDPEAATPANYVRPVSVEDVELVMRDLRRFAQAVRFIGAPGSGRTWRGRQLRRPWRREIPGHVTARLPTVMSVTPGSLEVVVALSAVAATGPRTLGRFLYLIERYWNLRLRLRLEAATLRREIQLAEWAGEPSSEVLTIVDKVVIHGEDPRETSPKLRATVGVLTSEESIDLAHEAAADEPDEPDLPDE